MPPDLLDWTTLAAATTPAPISAFLLKFLLFIKPENLLALPGPGFGACPETSANGPAPAEDAGATGLVGAAVGGAALIGTGLLTLGVPLPVLLSKAAASRACKSSSDGTRLVTLGVPLPVLASKAFAWSPCNVDPKPSISIGKERGDNRCLRAALRE